MEEAAKRFKTPPPPPKTDTEFAAVQERFKKSALEMDADIAKAEADAFQAALIELDKQAAQKLQEVWKTLLQQAGAFKSVIDAKSQAAGGGITAVTLGCQFERVALNTIVAFDGDGKIAGLHFVPRP